MSHKWLVGMVCVCVMLAGCGGSDHALELQYCCDLIHAAGLCHYADQGRSAIADGSLERTLPSGIWQDNITTLQRAEIVLDVLTHGDDAVEQQFQSYYWPCERHQQLSRKNNRMRREPNEMEL